MHMGRTCVRARTLRYNEESHPDGLILEHVYQRVRPSAYISHLAPAKPRVHIGRRQQDTARQCSWSLDPPI